MLREADRQTVDGVRAGYAATYSEMRAAGYTAVGEFHYLGLEEARAPPLHAAREAEIELVLLLAAYARGGLRGSGRTRSPTTWARSSRCAPRASTSGSPPTPCARARPAWLEEIGRYAAAEGLPLARPRRRAAAGDRGVRGRDTGSGRSSCLPERAASGRRRRSSTRRTRTTAELDLLAEAGSRVCVCPTTEANLGDGYAPVAAFCERGLGICIGSDSNVRIDPLEELRELEGIARRASGRRNVVSVGSLLSFGADEGAAALGLAAWPETRST